MESQEVAFAIIGGLVSAIHYWFWHDKKKLETKVEKLTQDLTDVRSNQQHYTTHTEVRELIRESIDPIKQDQREMKADIKEVLSLISQISQSLAVIHAYRGFNSDGLHNPNNR